MELMHPKNLEERALLLAGELLNFLEMLGFGKRKSNCKASV